MFKLSYFRDLVFAQFNVNFSFVRNMCLENINKMWDLVNSSDFASDTASQIFLTIKGFQNILVINH